MNSDKEFIALRDSISEGIEQVTCDVELASWNFYTNSTQENLQKMNEAQNKYLEFYNNNEVYGKLKQISDNGGVSDNHLKKHFKRLIREFGDGIEFQDEIQKINEKENEVSQISNSHISKIDGEPVSKATLTNILLTEKNQELRQKAYLAKVSAGDEIADDLIALVKLRNDLAVKKGYDNYFDYQLEEEFDINWDRLNKLIEKVSNEVTKVREFVINKNKKDLASIFNISIKDLKNYHFGYLTGDNPDKEVNARINSVEDVIKICKTAYLKMGYDIDKLPVTLDLFPRKNKNTHGFSFPIKAGKDSRILANLVGNATSVITLLHELGHSVFTINTDINLPYLDKDSTCTMTEAVAMMMGDLLRLENFMDNKLPDDIFDKYKNFLIEDSVKFINASMVIINFEREMYKNPNQNLKQLWSELNVKYKGYTKNDEINKEWATIPHYISHPAYYQNYFRATLIKEQLYSALQNTLGELTKNQTTAEFLNKNLFRYGSSKDDDEILRIISGKELSVNDFCNKINTLNKK